MRLSVCVASVTKCVLHPKSLIQHKKTKEKNKTNSFKIGIIWIFYCVKPLILFFLLPFQLCYFRYDLCFDFDFFFNFKDENGENVSGFRFQCERERAKLFGFLGD